MNNVLQLDDGFSSEEELRQEEIACEQHKNQIIENSIKQQVRFIIPPRPQIKDKPYNLYPDTVTGWAPKIQLPLPIPIIFDNQFLDSFIKCVHKAENPNARLCYLGPRYENSYYAWFNKQFTFPYGHIKAPSDITFTNRFFCGSNPQTVDGSLIFDSFFESGNLDCAIQVGSNQYELFIRVDSNTKGHLQWFNFSVKNMQRMTKYKFHICNFQKNKSLYSRGMKPYILSKKKSQTEKIGWEQTGQHVHYDRKSLKSAQAINYNMVRSYRLSFQYSTQYQNDQLQIAYCIPYTYSYLCNFMQQISQKYQKKGIVRMSKLCTSLGGLEVPLLIVHEKNVSQNKETQQTNPSKQSPSKHSPSKQSPQKNRGQITKKCIIISGRAHPGESNSSFMMHGFIQFICGDSKIAQYLRKFIVFKIIPMLNPDGVALGNYRTGLSGRDFNRQFRNPDRIIFPEVYAVRKLVSENKQIFKQNLLMFLDFHGHSIKKNVFMYGPEFPIINKNYYECRIFPKLLGNRTEMFRYHSCIFKVSEFKETTARAVLLRKLNIPMTFTIQASNGSYYDHQILKNIPFTQSAWRKMGSIVGQTIQQYMNLILLAQQMRNQKSILRQKYKKEGRSHLHRSLRKKDKKRQQESPNKINNELLILPGIQDQRIRMLFQQIKNAEQQKLTSQVSDDELSQGSSDQQGQGDDLSQHKTNFLYKIIKNKKMKVLSKCRFSEDQIKQHRFATNQDQKSIEINNQEYPDKSTNCINRSKEGRRSYIQRNRNKLNLLIKGQRSREKPTARIINFSFGSSCPAREYSFEERETTKNRINLLEACFTSKIQDKKHNEVSLGRLVDLPDYSSFRKTFTSCVREKIDYRIQNKLETVYISKNSRRFEDYKLRKIALNSFKI